MHYVSVKVDMDMSLLDHYISKGGNNSMLISKSSWMGGMFKPTLCNGPGKLQLYFSLSLTFYYALILTWVTEHGGSSELLHLVIQNGLIGEL